MGALESLCNAGREFPPDKATIETPETAERLFQLARSGNVGGMNALQHKFQKAYTHLPLNVTNAEGQTLMHVAARQGHTEFCRELLRQNLVERPNKEGQLPKDVALLGGYSECAAMFAGANAPVADEEEDSPAYIPKHHKALYTGDVDTHPALEGNELGLGFALILDGKPGKSMYQVSGTNHPGGNPGANPESISQQMLPLRDRMCIGVD